MDFYLETKKRPGAWVEKRWWEYLVLSIMGTQEAAEMVGMLEVDSSGGDKTDT